MAHDRHSAASTLRTPNLPANVGLFIMWLVCCLVACCCVYVFISTSCIPTKMCWLKMSGRFPMDMRMPPRKSKSMLASDPPKSAILVQRLAILGGWSDVKSQRVVPCKMCLFTRCMSIKCWVQCVSACRHLISFGGLYFPPTYMCWELVWLSGNARKMC